MVIEVIVSDVKRGHDRDVVGIVEELLRGKGYQIGGQPTHRENYIPSVAMASGSRRTASVVIGDGSLDFRKPDYNGGLWPVVQQVLKYLYRLGDGFKVNPPKYA